MENQPFGYQDRKFLSENVNNRAFRLGNGNASGRIGGLGQHIHNVLVCLGGGLDGGNGRRLSDLLHLHTQKLGSDCKHIHGKKPLKINLLDKVYQKKSCHKSEKFKR